MKKYPLLLILLLSACSGTSEIVPEEFVGQLTDSFKTDIKNNGLKLFTYRAKLVQSSNAQQIPLPHEQRASQKKRSKKRYQAPDLTAWTQKIEHGLSQTIAMTGYCREGYIEISRSIQYDRGSIRGECKEGATEKDIARFDS
ncbi:hypothetical protein JK628_09295 [Shewanella sp. KX20019]|uniref:hypothetical protein n=1 Tax=Shewanella sp. KX20019 TaxID=2803864 RepID=UPI001926C172|nr:hypothetical protein [Shewanella sp. KX20019]QQX81981.1 hypothetical protein JK628_09295 [Shewanella sp. KX20019]